MLTGFYVIAPPELGGKRLQLLKEVVPGASRVGILWNPGDIQPPLIVRDTEKAARPLGIRLKSLELQRVGVPARRFAEMFGEVFESALLAQVDAVIAVEDYLTMANRRGSWSSPR